MFLVLALATKSYFPLCGGREGGKQGVLQDTPVKGVIVSYCHITSDLQRDIDISNLHLNNEIMQILSNQRNYRPAGFKNND